MIDTKTAIEKITNGEFDNLFTDIYIDSSMIDYQKKRYVHAIEQYETIFCPDKVAILSAPGRSEVCGNHTDHQHGMVLATSINLDTIAVSAKNNNDVVRFVSDGYDMITLNINDLEVNDDEAGTTDGFDVVSLGKTEGKSATIFTLCFYEQREIEVAEVKSMIEKTKQMHREVVVGTIISGLYNDMKINSVEIAQISQYAENVFFKKPCGLMDQMACSVGGMVNIDFKDPTKPIVKKVPTEFEKYDYSLCIVDTKGDHVDLTDDYAMIPSEMKKVANFLGEDYLRDCDSNEFYIRLDEIREAVGDRPVLRAIHFFNEEHNVKNAVSSLENGKFVEFLDAIRKSGNSSFKYLQNVYTTRDIQHQNISVALALSESLLRNYGVCRVHGGGFAGTIQAFVKNDFVGNYKEFINKIFGENSCHVLKVRKYGGIKVM